MSKRKLSKKYLGQMLRQKFNKFDNSFSLMDISVEDQNLDLQIRLKSQATFVGAVRAALEAAASRIGLDEKACGHVSLALTEAMANIINHGYGRVPDQPIWIGLKAIEKDGRRGVHLILEDECPQVDLAKIKSRPLDEIRPGGLGVHIIKEIMEDVTYAHRECGVGLRLTMNKFPTPVKDTAPQNTAADEAKASS